MKWIPFDESKGSSQELPPVYKPVLVYTESRDSGSPRALVVGYRKNGAGDPESPYFVNPGHGCKVLAWSDCLPPSEKYREVRDAFTNYWREAEEAMTHPHATEGR